MREITRGLRFRNVRKSEFVGDGVALVSMSHPMPPKWWRRLVVLAAPTCTLWRFDPLHQVYFFRLWERWRITHQEVENT